MTLNEIFDETIVVPLLSKKEEVVKLFEDCALSELIGDKEQMADMIVSRIRAVGCKTALRIVERAVAAAEHGISSEQSGNGDANIQAIRLGEILDDLVGDEGTSKELCSV